MTGVTEREKRQVEQANASGRTPVVFIHGLWLLPSSWDRWAELFEDAGYAAVTPSWPTGPSPPATTHASPRPASRTGSASQASSPDPPTERSFS